MAETMAGLGVLGLLYTVALWILFAFGCGWIAETKGHGQVWWFFLGLLFGPPMVLIVGLSDGKPLPSKEGR